jgi:hypothetical protein
MTINDAKSRPKGKRMVAVFRGGRPFTGTGLKKSTGIFPGHRHA